MSKTKTIEFSLVMPPLMITDVIVDNEVVGRIRKVRVNNYSLTSCDGTTFPNKHFKSSYTKKFTSRNEAKIFAKGLWS